MAAFTFAWAAITIFVLKGNLRTSKTKYGRRPTFRIYQGWADGPNPGRCRMDAAETRKKSEQPGNTEPDKTICIMSTGGIIICLAAVALLLIVWGIVTNNSLIAKRNRVRLCRSGICVVLKQRNDLIPNLVASVRTYMGYENELLTRIADLRSRTAAAPEGEQIRNGGEISALLGRLNIAVENYPELKANAQFLHLQGQIAQMEDELQAIRRTCNAAVTDYNNAIEMFPSSIIAAWRRHTQEELIEIPEEEKQPVSVADLFRS